MTTPTYTVAIVDDQELIRTGFSLIVQSAGDIAVVGEAGDGAEALTLLAELAAADRLPHVVLMDVRMPGMDGITATQEIVARYPEVRVLVLTTFDLDEYALDAVAAGASGFLLKDARAAELLAAVRAVAEGDSVIAPHVTRRLLLRMHETGSHQSPTTGGGAAAQRDGIAPAAPHRDVRTSVLTDREYEVFVLIAEGLSNAEIGARLFLSESTVKTHVGRVLGKLSLRDRVHAVIMAYEIGLSGQE